MSQFQGEIVAHYNIETIICNIYVLYAFIRAVEQTLLMILD